MSADKKEKPKKAPGKGPKKGPAESAAAKKGKLDAAKDKAAKKITESTKGKLESLKLSTEVEKFAEGIDSVKKLREKIKEAPLTLIEKIEDAFPGITIAAFTKTLKGDFKLDPKNWSSDKIYSNFKANTKIHIDFLGNQGAENGWGWSDMAKIEWRGMTKYEGGNDSVKRVSLRRVGLKGQNKSNRGYYDRRGYIYIHTNDAVMYHNVVASFKTEFREKAGNKYKEINAQSYVKYAQSEYAKEDKKFMDKHKKSWQFLSRRPKISNEEILAIRKKIGGLEGLSIADRIKRVTAYLCKPENMIRANHCGDWVDRVYAIAGVRRRKHVYPRGRSAMAYAFVDNDPKKGWKPKKNPDGSWNQKRYDARISGLHAKQRDWNKIQVGDWIWINNRNKYDYAGNHSGIFLGWVDKSKGLARMANWYANKPGRQKIVTYNFNNIPVVHISRMIEIDDSLPDSEESTGGQMRGMPKNPEYARIPGLDEQEASSKRKKEWSTDYLKHSTQRERKTAYHEMLKKYAKRVCRGTNLNWRVLAMITVKETGWGQSKLARVYKNVFGMKAHNLPKQLWRVYKSVYESFLDARIKLTTATRYRPALRFRNNPLMQLAIILANGYCTDRGYFASMLGKKGIASYSGYGSPIGFGSDGYIYESKLREILDNGYFKNHMKYKYFRKAHGSLENFIQQQIIIPAKRAGRLKP